MLQFENAYFVDLDKGPVVDQLRKPMHYGDDKANRIGVTVTKNGQAVTLSGECTGKAVLGDDTWVMITNGVVDGNEAYIELPSACYSIEGPIRIFLNISSGDTEITLLDLTGYVKATQTDSAIDPDHPTFSVSTLEYIITTGAQDQINAIEEAGAAQMDAIEDKGEEVIASIPSDYTSIVQEAEDTLDQAEALIDAVDDIVLVQSTEPVEEHNKIWVDSDDTGSVQVPTIAELNEVAEDVSDLKSALTQNITFTDASYIKHEDGTVGSNYGSAKASGFIAIIPGNTFNLSGYVGSETISSIIGLAFYDKNKTYVSGVQYDGNNISVIAPQTAMFVRFTVYTSCISSYIVNVGSILPTHDFTLLTSFPYTKSEMETGVENIGAMPKYLRLIDGFTFESGKFINDNGIVISVFYSSLSEYIPVDNLEMVYAALTNAIPVSFYDKDKTWISNYYDNTVTTYTNATPKKYNITPPVNCKYIRISNVHTALSDNSVYIGEGHGYLKAKQEFFPGSENGKYVAVVNKGGVASVRYAQLTDYISVTGLTGFYTSLTDILSACYYDENKTYISGITGTTGESPSWRVPTIPQNAAYIRISNDTRYNNGGIKIIVNLMEAITDAPSEAEIQNLQNQIDAFDTPRNILAMYNDIICIGDSLTWSQVYYSASGQRQAYKPYPNILGSLCGATSHLYATPGDTAILWWQRSSAGAFDNHGLYIVFLGTNAGFTDTISTDCVGTDPDNFANTNTGQYGRILQTITNNGDKAVLVLPYGGGGGTAEALATTRDVIDQFGTKYNFPVINLDNTARTNAYYHYYPDKSGQNMLHFNDLGYAWVANEICQQINKLPVADQWNISRTQ